MISKELILKQQKRWRVLSLCFLVILLGRLTHSLWIHDWSLIPETHKVISPLISLIITVIGLCFSVFLAIKPKYVTLLGFFALFYSSTVLLDSPFHPFGVFGYLMGSYLVFPRRPKKKSDYILPVLFTLLFSGVSVSGIRFGVVPFFRNISITLGQLIAVLGVWTIHDVQQGGIIQSPKSFQISLHLKSDFSFLNERDIEWLMLVLQGEKYQSIAARYDLSEGTVRNRLSTLYKQMNLAGGQNEFLRQYSDIEVPDDAEPN